MTIAIALFLLKSLFPTNDNNNSTVMKYKTLDWQATIYTLLYHQIKSNFKQAETILFFFIYLLMRQLHERRQCSCQLSLNLVISCNLPK